MLALRSAVVFGTCVIAASLFSGCATSRPDRVPMARDQLNHFVRDCRQKANQVAMLQNMRQTQDERILAGLEVASNPLLKYVNPAQHRQLQDIGSGQTNWYIDYHLQMLARECP
jgi:hypothetical protein